MVKHGELELAYENGLMLMKAEGYSNGMRTTQQFKLPLKIEVRAKTDGEIHVKYENGFISLNSIHFRNALAIQGIAEDEFKLYKKRGEIPMDEFFDIEWILGKNVMAVKANGEVRHVNDNYGYIKTYANNPDFNLSSGVIIAAQCGSTVTVESLRVTEL